MNVQEAPLMRAVRVSKRFAPARDAADRLAGLLTGKKPVGEVQALSEVNLAIHRGEVVGLVGESGCGKSTLGRIIADIYKPSSGEVVWPSLPVDASTHRRLRAQMVFQDPYSSLNPRMRVGQAIAEAPVAHGMVRAGDAAQFAESQLARAGLAPDFAHRFAHQLSGGQRQRVGIARALAVSPQLLVCDESVAALDVSIQAQIINLFARLRGELGLTLLFISHDLGVVEHLSDRVVIMYLGRVVEEAATEELYRRPAHPYTQALLAQVPRMHERGKRFETIRGEIPSPLNPPSGCHFHPRCPHAMARCKEAAPALREIAPGHFSACHLHEDARLGSKEEGACQSATA